MSRIYEGRNEKGRFAKGHIPSRKGKHDRFNREGARIATRKYKKSEKGRKTRASYLLKCLYGITLVEYDEKFELQHGVCAICGRPQLHRRLAVDHNHKTKKIRGLLCDACNLLVGQIESPSKLIPKVKEYLEEWK